jgi:hypothetical protein
MAKSRSTSGLIGGCQAIRTVLEMAALSVRRFLVLLFLSCIPQNAERPGPEDQCYTLVGDSGRVSWASL